MGVSMFGQYFISGDEYTSIYYSLYLFGDSEMFLFNILELEVLSFYLSGMPAGGSGARDSTDGLWRLGGIQSKCSVQEDRRAEEGGGFLGSAPRS